MAAFVELLSAPRVVRVLGAKDPSLNLGFFFFFLWFELHHSLSQATLDVESRLAFGSEGPKLKLGSQSDLSLSSGPFFFFFLWLELHGSLC
jgi:hypothetical protein